MFTQAFRGHMPGETETPAVTATDEGIETVLDGLSPVMVAWEEIKQAEPEPEPQPVHTHTWGEPVFTWKGYERALALFTCKTDDSHKQTVSTHITKKTTEATTEKEGKNVYTASVTFEGKTYTDEKTEILPKRQRQEEEKQTDDNRQETVRNGWEKEADGWRYYKNGKAVNGWLRIKTGNGKTKWYHFTDTVMDHGWYKQTGETGKYAKYNGKWFYLGVPGKPDSGYMRTGWLKEKGNWYFFKTNGVMKENAWQKYNGKWYYLGSKGKMLSDRWLKYNGKWYYMDKKGAMKTGWVKSKDKWYYMNKKGAMLAGAWKKYKGSWYFFRGQCQ